MATRRFLRIFASLVMAAAAVPSPAWADLGKIELDARIYTKHLYQNNDSQGVLWLGNPFWPDDIAGSNGVGSELELSLRGKVSSQVEAGARMASRFGERWHDWWESGNSFYDRELNTSGDSAGMNRASYVKLRGTYLQVLPDAWGLEWVRVGASDLAMFNPWTIGKVRYIDRDNARGYFLSGRLGEPLQYHLAAIALPKLWVGPNWSTGIGDPALSNAFWSRDWAYAAAVRWRPDDRTSLRLVANVTQDLEANVADPDAVGSVQPTCTDKLGQPIPGCAADHAVDLVTRYGTLNATVELERDLSETIRLSFLLGFAAQRIDPRLAANGVALNQGMFPMIYRDTEDLAGTLRLVASDPFENGFSFQAEYFNIGKDWNAIFGARREADVLLTDGLVGTGGQLPTLNLANEFVDFDEDWVESCIGWHGGTGVLLWDGDDTHLKAEYTFIGYNTNTVNSNDKTDQPRDVDTRYPTFLHSEGFTDTSLYDYANASDRGRDPRSVYRKNQFRQTHVAMLEARQMLDVGRGLELTAKLKHVADSDLRSLASGTDDDYAGAISIARVRASLPVADGFKVALFGQIDHWDEENRKGTQELGYGDDVTDKQTLGLQTDLRYAGLTLRYHLEYVHKVQDRQREADQLWNVWRSKATVEAAW